MSLFEPYFAKGLVKRHRPDFRQIERQLDRAENDLRTFALVVKDDPEWAAAIAYQSMLRAGRALVFALGYLPAGAAQHKTVVELTGRVLGDEYAGLVRRFDVMRRRRNVFFYDSEDLHSGTEAQSAVECAAALLAKIKDKVRELK